MTRSFRDSKRGRSRSSARALVCGCAIVGLLSAVVRIPAASLAQDGAGANTLLAPQPADANTEAPPQAAIEHYQRGRALYQAGRYREAAEALKIAVALDPDSADLVYNLGRVYELLGDIDPAIEHYERYRTMLAPDAHDEQERIDGVLQRLRGAREEQLREQAVDANPIQRALDVPPRPIARRGVLWGFAGSAALVLVAGGVTGALALKVERDANRFEVRTPAGFTHHDDKVKQANRLALSSDILLASGAALGITSILLYALHVQAPRSARVQVETSARPGGMVLSLRGRL